ncbi:tRNA pseudouridine(38-40) synthase TruA [Nocardioides daejeonensis]|uniref:tRNA pseudouridine(38-40) synthase TruA n=1 Tax=Nocardioides daejeonensis TaxID=1046556 RepID=UPI001EF5BF89|nr:tRNA pseudouridine(38-40) synthase TruA [Nocardioides daejeonensis]
MRIRIDLAYDGTDFKGWARQPGLRTVQGELEAALATVLRLPQVQVTCAGRTDAGVHARGQVCHVDLAEEELLAGGRSRGSTSSSPEQLSAQLARRVNGLLPGDLRVRGMLPAPAGFDARFSASWRRYAYRIADNPAATDPLTRNHVLAWGRPLDVVAMNAASAPLVGLHDFASFCKQREGATTVRTLLDLSWRRQEGVVVGNVRADAFCHNMVRALVGCLVAVGERRREPEWAAEVLRGVRRDPAVSVVPPHGLTLEEVRYPEGADLAAQAERARNKRTPVEEQA